MEPELQGTCAKRGRHIWLADKALYPHLSDRGRCDPGGKVSNTEQGAHCGRCGARIILGHGVWYVDVNDRRWFADCFCPDMKTRHSPYARPDQPKVPTVSAVFVALSVLAALVLLAELAMSHGGDK